jgi:hypothetical protein
VSGIRQVIVESGHMVDTPDREVPQFPPEAERRITAAIDKVLERWDVGPGTVVLAQGARGTDILVAESALRKGARVKLLLALPPPDFEGRSVSLPRSKWSERFRLLLDRCEVVIQTEAIGAVPTGENPFDRNNRWVLDQAAQLAEPAGIPLRALVVWDQAQEGRVGGTATFVALAEQRGVDLQVINPRQTWRSPKVPYWERQWPGDRKRLLALDGGGIRGIITLEILARLEAVLGEGKDSFVLADYFDYVAGTSTGAIIATALSLGHRVEDIAKLYRQLAPQIFHKRFLPARIRSLYKDRALSRQLEGFLGQSTTLGSDEIRTLLLVVMHRIDTDSIWPLSNNTWARYNDRSRDDCNLDFRLSKVVRGSTAAPVFFMPETIPVGPNEANFEDGGVTPFNNPALLLFEMATSPRYRLGWQEGADRLLLVSVGTGFAASAHDQLRRSKITLMFQAKNLIKVIMNGSSTENDRLCRVLGACRHGDPIDREFDATDVDVRPRAAPLFTYVRYNADISAKGLSKVGLGHIDPKRVARLDALSAVEDLAAIGRKAAEHVKEEHFQGFRK